MMTHTIDAIPGKRNTYARWIVLTLMVRMPEVAIVIAGLRPFRYESAMLIFAMSSV
ncbi:MAG: hypothetical protein ACI86M_002120 [Saprospiraceae bacterium]|jgi:hypothetical protein